MAGKDKSKAATAGKRRPTADELPGVLLAISEGQSLRKACEELGLDAPSTYKLIDEDPELRQHYARARAMGGDVYAHQVATVGAGVLAKRIDPDRGRVAIDAFKWTAARMAPKAWGDKQTHEVSGPDGKPVRTDVTVRFVRPGADKAAALPAGGAGGAEGGIGATGLVTGAGGAGKATS